MAHSVAPLQKSRMDYFGRYFTRQEFDFGGLIDADFLVPIRLLYQQGHYVSAAKLFMSFVDSLGYVEFGETVPNPFTAWLNAYVDLSSVGVTAEELWEQRNSLLHMSNLDSRKVVAGKVRRLMFYVGTFPAGMATEGTDAKYYDLQLLMLKTIEGLGPWVESYNIDRDKIHAFVQRYDLIASDSRMLRIALDQDPREEQ